MVRNKDKHVYFDAGDPGLFEMSSTHQSYFIGEARRAKMNHCGLT